jgi:hypothetical protein
MRVQAEAMLESAIAVAQHRLVTAVDHAERVEACEELACLVKQRTPEAVARMELERGLRR